MITADTQAMVYETVETIVSEGGSIYGCTYGNGHRYPLGYRPEFSSEGGQGIASEILAGPIVAFQRDSATSNSAHRAVVVADLRNGRQLRPPVTVGPGFINAIVVKSNGSVAWIGESHYVPPTAANNYMSSSEYMVEAVDKTGKRLLASGPGIDPSSLALVGSTLYWTQGGKPASAVLN